MFACDLLNNLLIIFFACLCLKKLCYLEHEGGG
jgi:hypothetical protein